MKHFIDWLKPNSRQQTAVDFAEGEYNTDYSYGWIGNDQADSSIFNSGRRTAKKPADKNSVPPKTLSIEGNSLCIEEEDEGFDPYNSGRFKTEKK